MRTGRSRLLGASISAVPLSQPIPVKNYFRTGFPAKLIGNLRTTTKFTTTTPVDWEKTGTRTSVSAGKMKLKMQSVSRSTTTRLNVNTNVKL